MEKKWWHKKTAYQIYPKSFLDTNGDGIGDLRGIIQKLDYLQELGIELIWLSPIYCSPLADQGYDISDYYNIDPRFGTMEEFEELIAEGKKRGIGIVMDLVVNHCSDEHVWFQKACADPDGPYGKYFYIEKYQDGKVPCNWRSYFGGSVWEPLPGHPDRCYLHLFHKKQPDLNWENPQLRKEIYDMINWWLDKGLAGFRIDAIINIKKALPWRDYPADREDGMTRCTRMLDDAVGIGEFLGEMRDICFKPHNAFAVGEVFNAREEELKEFIGDNGYFSSMFDFRATVWGTQERGCFANEQITPDAYRDCCFESQRLSGDIGLYSNIIENHDEPRGVSHYIPEVDVNDVSKKMLATIQFMLKGLPFLYQGQEIGMENVPFTSVDQFDDIATLDEYQVAIDAGLSPEDALKAVSRYSRDNARTPFQWTAGDNAGFTSGKPWLMINPNYPRINLAAQEKDPESVYQYYRSLIALRKNPEYQDTIIYGSLVPAWQDHSNLFAFYRKGSGQTLLVIANFQQEERTLTLTRPYQKVLLSNYDSLAGDRQTITLKSYQAVILSL